MAGFCCARHPDVRSRLAQEATPPLIIMPYWLLLTCRPATSWSVQLGLDEGFCCLLLDGRQAVLTHHSYCVFFIESEMTGKSHMDLQQTHTSLCFEDGRKGISRKQGKFCFTHLRFCGSCCLVLRLSSATLTFSSDFFCVLSKLNRLTFSLRVGDQRLEDAEGSTLTLEEPRQFPATLHLIGVSFSGGNKSLFYLAPFTFQ